MSKNKHLFHELLTLTTEGRNKHSHRLDTLDIGEILSIINKEDHSIPDAVKKEIPSIVKAVKLIVNRIKSGGRLIYVGAGTSGRLGVIDATECPPTFGTNPKTIIGLVAGGKNAMFRSQEGAEDRVKDGKRDIHLAKVTKKDVVCGIAASARTPYVVAAIKEAKLRGAATIYVTTNPRAALRKTPFSDLRKNIDVAICPQVGPEVIMGSTRMKSGTAQKMVLNMLTTATMIRLGKVYENMMVDLKMNSNKLEERAKRVLMIATGVNYNTAAITLEKSGGHVKTAIVMIKANVSVKEARKRLKDAQGFVRMAILNKVQ